MPDSPVNPINPAVVKAEVKKEVNKQVSSKDFSWIRRDWVVIGVLFIILTTLSITTTISVNKVIDTSRQTQELVSNIDSVEDYQEYFSNLVSDSSLCAMLTLGAVNTEEIPYEPSALEKYYKDCVSSRSGPPPTTTTGG